MGEERISLSPATEFMFHAILTHRKVSYAESLIEIYPARTVSVP